MWIFLNDSFLSIVQKPGDTDVLTVRARVRGDIEAVFPDAKVVEGEGTDYRFRAKLPREVVANALAERVMQLSYGNFKSSVDDDERHDAYMDVWDVMYRYQTSAGR
jgi:hypothetical protein